MSAGVSERKVESVIGEDEGEDDSDQTTRADDPVVDES